MLWVDTDHSTILTLSNIPDCRYIFARTDLDDSKFVYACELCIQTHALAFCHPLVPAMICKHEDVRAGYVAAGLAMRQG